MSRRGSYFAYRQVVAKRAAQRDRSRGLSRHDAASEWLRLGPDERARFAQAVRSSADLRAWEGGKARQSGRAPP
jgi:hypothetical protein